MNVIKEGRRENKNSLPYQYSSTKPANAEYRIIRIGLIFIQYVPMKVAANRNMLMLNCHGLTDNTPKFSGERRRRVAAPSKPTTAGRSPRSTLCTGAALTYF